MPAGGGDDRQVRMDLEVVAMLRRAQQALHGLFDDIDAEPGGWEQRARLLIDMERIAALLVDATRRYAEALSHEAGQRDPPAGADPHGS